MIPRAAVLAATVALVGCPREERNYRPDPPFATGVRYAEAYEGNAYALSEGKRLYSAFNCNTCHADGGGAIGPALMDDAWLYGYEPEQIYDTIAKGRENGMPAFGGVARSPGITVIGTVPDNQIWQLVAYVRSTSGLAPSNAATGRNDHMQTRPSENETAPAVPHVVPPAAGSEPK